MMTLEQLLENALLAQVSLEEGLHSQIERQLSRPNIDEYLDVKQMLTSVNEVLKKHFSKLNRSLDDMAQTAEIKDSPASSINDEPALGFNVGSDGITKVQISQMLCDDFAALNLAAMGNTLLHTTAIAADSKDIAEVALEHLGNMTRFIIKLNELMPRVVAQELSSQFPEVMPTVGDLAAKNAKEVWLRSK